MSPGATQQRLYYRWTTRLDFARPSGASGIRPPGIKTVVAADWPSSEWSNLTTTTAESPLITRESPRSPREVEAEVILNRDLGEIVDLAPGWLNGEGDAINRIAIENAKRVLVEILARGASHPQVGPTPEGGVQAEWSLGDSELSITFEPSGDLYVFVMDLSTNNVEEHTLGRHAVKQFAELLNSDA